MTMTRARTIRRSFVRRAGIARLALGMCPALVVATTWAHALAFACAAFAVTLGANVFAALAGRFLSAPVRRLCVWLFVATLATAAADVVRLVAPGAAAALGAYVPLLAVHCLVLGRAEILLRLRRRAVRAAVADALATGGVLLPVLVLAGAVREAAGLWVTGAILPCGGFILLGLSLAFANHMASRVVAARRKGEVG